MRVDYGLLSGELLVNGVPLNQPPEDYRVQPLYKTLFGNAIVDDRVRLTEAQARGILELRLQRLTGLERDKIQAELAEVAARITELLEILASRTRRMEVMRDELLAVRAEIAARCTSVIEALAD